MCLFLCANSFRHLYHFPDLLVSLLYYFSDCLFFLIHTVPLPLYILSNPLLVVQIFLVLYSIGQSFKVYLNIC